MCCAYAPAEQDTGEITTKQMTVFQLGMGEVLLPDFTSTPNPWLLRLVWGLLLRKAVVRLNLIQLNHKGLKELSDQRTKNKPATPKKVWDKRNIEREEYTENSHVSYMLLF